MILSSSLRITSTYVENTAPFRYFQPPGEDHLHIRGEYLDSDEEINVGAGSPPHTWRILLKPFIASVISRITSTYVENTCYYTILLY